MRVPYTNGLMRDVGHRFVHLKKKTKKSKHVQDHGKSKLKKIRLDVIPAFFDCMIFFCRLSPMNVKSKYLILESESKPSMLNNTYLFGPICIRLVLYLPGGTDDKAVDFKTIRAR